MVTNAVVVVVVAVVAVVVVVAVVLAFTRQMEASGFEPLTSCLQSRRSTN